MNKRGSTRQSRNTFWCKVTTQPMRWPGSGLWRMVEDKLTEREQGLYDPVPGPSQVWQALMKKMKRLVLQEPMSRIRLIFGTAVWEKQIVEVFKRARVSVFKARKMIVIVDYRHLIPNGLATAPCPILISVIFSSSRTCFSAALEGSFRVPTRHKAGLPLPPILDPDQAGIRLLRRSPCEHDSGPLL